MRHVAPIARIKGAAIRELLTWYATRHGTVEMEQVIARLPPHLRGAFDPSLPSFGVLASTWYDAPQVHALLDALAAPLDATARRNLARGGARAIMGATLRGLYKALFSMFGSPPVYARLAPHLWRSYYDGGEIAVRLDGDAQAVSVITGWAAHHPLICDMNREAATCIYEEMGCVDVQTTRSQCVADGAPDCRFVTRWRPSRR